VGGARTKTIGAERSSGGRSGGGSVADGLEREPEREDFKFLKKWKDSSSGEKGN